jgi:hypothetical protein
MPEVVQSDADAPEHDGIDGYRTPPAIVDSDMQRWPWMSYLP